MERTSLVEILIPVVTAMIYKQALASPSEGDHVSSEATAVRSRPQIREKNVKILPQLLLYAQEVLSSDHVRQLLRIVKSFKGYDDWGELKKSRRDILTSISLR